MPGKAKKAFGRRLGPEEARGRSISIVVDGRPMAAFEGETIAAALIAANHLISQIRNGRVQAPFCNIGQCHGCLMEVNGRAGVKTCATYVEDGMVINTRRVNKREPDK